MFNQGDKISITNRESGRVVFGKIEVDGTELWHDVPEDDMDYGWMIFVKNPNSGKIERFSENRYAFELIKAAEYEVPASRPFELQTWNEFNHAWEINGTPEEYAAYVARNTPTVETAPRELNAFEKILAGTKFSTVAEIAPEAIERAEKIRDIEKQATATANQFAALEWQVNVVDPGLSPRGAERILNNRAFNDVYESEVIRLMKKAGL